MSLAINETAASIIDPAGCRRLLADNPSTKLIDVRTPAEYRAGYIPGSHNVPLASVADHATDLAKLDGPMVLVCATGSRASQAQDLLAKHGATHVSVLQGGTQAWRANGLTSDASSSAEVWAMDRQVRLVAGSISLVGIAASVFVPQAKWIAGGIGAGLTFSALSNTCGMANVLSRLPYNKPTDFDVSNVIGALRSGPETNA